MLYFLLKLMCIKIIHYYMYSLRIFYDKGVCVFVSPDRLLRGFYMAYVCFVYVCDVHHVDKRGLCMLLTGIRGDKRQGYPLPLLGQSNG